MQKTRWIRYAALGLVGVSGGFAAIGKGHAQAAAPLPPKPSNAAVQVVDVCPGNDSPNQMTNDQFEFMATQQQL